GTQRRAFNLWGEAAQQASAMADTSLSGAIQVTESVYQALKGRYLFQLRGHHYLEGVGELSTYLLSGRL
ncbi:MAG: adenylate/guanylate cyclase, partial [Gammaproteobacteria bacterium]|nr:adenylate/guanylate cyclase [Gammaproteobacteria bacterium]